MRALAGPTTVARGARGRRWLLATQVSLTVILLTAATALSLGTIRLLEIDPGFSRRDTMALALPLDNANYPTAESSRVFYRALLRELGAVPGIAAVGAVTALPLYGGVDFERPYSPESWAPSLEERPSASVRMATPGYFRAIGVPIVAGRSLSEADDESGRRVVVINETLARRAWGALDPVGRQLLLDYMGGRYSYEVVGVVRDVRYDGPRLPPRAEVFIPHAQNPYHSTLIVLRSAAEPGGVERAVRRTVWALDPLQPVGPSILLEELLSRSIAADRFTAGLAQLLAISALALSGLGTYSLCSYVGTGRRAELALRLAVGARGTDLARLIVVDAMRTALPAVAVGTVLSLMAIRLIAPLTFALRTADGALIAASHLALIAVLLLATLAPARRALATSVGDILRPQG